MRNRRSQKHTNLKLGIRQVQSGICSIDEVRKRLNMAPWGLPETSEPVVFTSKGPIPMSKVPELLKRHAKS